MRTRSGLFRLLLWVLVVVGGYYTANILNATIERVNLSLYLAKQNQSTLNKYNDILGRYGQRVSALGRRIMAQKDAPLSFLRSSVAINVETLDYESVKWNDAGTGSGVVIEMHGRPVIVTCEHVVDSGFLEDYSRILVDFYNPKLSKIPARIVYSDKLNDIAILVPTIPVHNDMVKRVKISKDIITWGEGIFVVGCPGSHRFIPTQGFYVGQTDNKRKKMEGKKADKLHLLSCLIYYGNSGGGIFSARTGELIGIISLIEIDPSRETINHLSLGVASESIKNAIDRASVKVEKELKKIYK